MDLTPERDLEAVSGGSRSTTADRDLSANGRRLSSQATSSGVVIDGEPVDFAMVLSDVSSYRSSKAKRFLKSMWIFGQQQLADVDTALAQLVASLEEHGFRAKQVQAEEGDGAAVPEAVLLLLTGTPDRLSREDYREQLDLWIQSRGLGELPATTTPAPAPALSRRVLGAHHQRGGLLRRPARAAAAARPLRAATRAAEARAARRGPPLDPRHLPAARPAVQPPPDLAPHAARLPPGWDAPPAAQRLRREGAPHTPHPHTAPHTPTSHRTCSSACPPTMHCACSATHSLE